MASPDDRARWRLGYLLSKIASGAPAPASGSAAAAVAAASAALLQKVALRSTKWPRANEAHDEAEEMRLRAEELIELDASGYLQFVEALRTGVNVDAARQRTIEVPLEIARVAARVVELGHEMEASGNQNLRADSVAAAILAHSAVTVAAMLVQVNLTPGASDPRVVEAQRLVRAVSASARRRASRVRSDGPDRASTRSRDSGQPSRARTARAGPQAPSAGSRPASSSSR